MQSRRAQVLTTAVNMPLRELLLNYAAAPVEVHDSLAAWLPDCLVRMLCACLHCPPSVFLLRPMRKLCMGNPGSLVQAIAFLNLGWTSH